MPMYPPGSEDRIAYVPLPGRLAMKTMPPTSVIQIPQTQRLIYFYEANLPLD